jgi:hypothetical protein
VKFARVRGVARQRLRRRHGHPPGRVDVSTVEPGRSFLAVPNFYYFEACGRPCYLPLYSAPSHDTGKPVTEGWPCEFYSRHNRSRGPHCYSQSQGEGDGVLVMGQVRGQSRRNEIGQVSDIWDVILLPPRKATRNAEYLEHRGDMFVAYAPDIWLGNTGWHGIEWRPAAD